MIGSLQLNGMEKQAEIAEAENKKFKLMDGITSKHSLMRESLNRSHRDDHAWPPKTPPSRTTPPSANCDCL